MTNALALMKRRLAAVAIVLLAVIGPLSAMSAEAAGPVPWQATVGFQSRNMAIQSNFFFPNNITIDAGDSITWTLKSGEFHTVSFLSGAAAPPLIIPDANGQPTFNPLVGGPVGGNTYTGLGYVNSGVIAGPIPATKFTLTFSKEGNYQYNCLVHAPMKGWVHVQAAGAPYPHSQAFYNEQAREAEAHSIAQGYGLIALGLFDAVKAGVGHVTAGIGKFYSAGSIAIVSFLPKVEFVHVGQTVTWNNRDPEFPHTVTFGLTNFDQNDPFLAFGPIGVDHVGVNTTHATVSNPASANVNSGVLVAQGPIGTQFKMKFTGPGIYHYYCALHDNLGMTGTVVVLPGRSDD